MKKLLLLALLPSICFGQVKISQLPAGVAPSGSEIFPAVQSGNTVSLMLGQVVSLALGQLSSTTTSNLWTVSSTVSCTTSTVLFWGGQCGPVVGSVNFTVPSGFTGSGSLSGTVLNLTLSASSQSSSQFYASPSATSGTPGFRAIVASDVPPIALASSGNGGVSGTLPIASGGTGATTATNAVTNLLPSQSGQAGNALITNGSTVSWSGAAATAQTGNFTGTLTGCTSTTTGTMYWDRTGNIVTLYTPSSITCTSNTTAMTLTGLPATITPANSQAVACAAMENNGAGLVVGECVANPVSENIIFAPGIVTGSYLEASTTGFTSSGTKGIQSGWSMTYAVQ
jgi:hypothetical protein